MSEETPGTPRLAKSLKHELRTPLNHIIGYSEMLIEEAQDAGRESILADLGRIHSAGRSLLEVIDDLFDPEKAPAFWKYPSLLDHEVRTPLNQIIGYAELLQENAGTGEDDRYLADLGRIHGAARGLLEMLVRHFGSEWTEPPDLKAAAATRPPGFAGTPARAGGGGSAPPGRILVADDDPANREMLQRRLERLGHAVRLAENGRQVLEMLAQEPFDLLLLDLQMPEMDGYEVLDRAKADGKLREIPIIVLSASDDSSRVVHCIERGAADYLAKPFDPVLLRARIGACLEKKKLHDREQAAHEALERSQRRLAGELAKAADYVRSLLPVPMTGRLQSEWCFEPSEQLGGDAFGHHWIDDDHLAIYLLDVCGHGVGAALLSVSVLNALRAHALPGADFRDPAAVLAALDLAFPAEAQNFFYFTIWYGVYRASSRELRYSTGGHPAALLLNDREIEVLVTDGATIGCFDGSRYVSKCCDVAPGARLLVFSDGVFEIFLENERVRTWSEFLADFGRAEVMAMSPSERLQHARRLRGAEILEDDFSLLELRFP